MRTLGKYSLIRKLGTGGMAELFLAKAQGPGGFEKWLAIKTILPQLAENPSFVEMFLGEARLAACLSHPNIVHIFDVGQCDDTYYLAMEYVDGVDLRKVLASNLKSGRQVPFAVCARIAAQIAEALQYAHDFIHPGTGAALQLVHRDVSPDNILVSRQGQVKLVDFGIAKAQGFTAETRTGMLKGKYAYMAPEQLRGEALDRRADVFSLGMVLYELIAGDKPFEGKSDADRMFAALYEEFPALGSKRSGVPARLEEIVHRAIAKNRDDRYDSCAAFAAALEAYIRHDTSADEPVDLTKLVSSVEEANGGSGVTAAPRAPGSGPQERPQRSGRTPIPSVPASAAAPIPSVPVSAAAPTPSLPASAAAPTPSVPASAAAPIPSVPASAAAPIPSVLATAAAPTAGVPATAAALVSASSAPAEAAVEDTRLVPEIVRPLHKPPVARPPPPAPAASASPLNARPSGGAPMLGDDEPPAVRDTLVRPPGFAFSMDTSESAGERPQPRPRVAHRAPSAAAYALNEAEPSAEYPMLRQRSAASPQGTSSFSVRASDSAEEFRLPKQRAPVVALSIALAAALGGGYVLFFGATGAEAHEYSSAVPVPMSELEVEEPSLAPQRIDLPQGPLPETAVAVTQTRVERSEPIQQIVSAHAASAQRKKTVQRNRADGERRKVESKRVTPDSEPEPIGSGAAANAEEASNELDALPAPTPVQTELPAAAPGRLDFRVRPYATVFVDGRQLGQTPFRPVSLPAGVHTVRLTNPELQHDEQFEIEVKPGEVNVVKRDLAAR